MERHVGEDLEGPPLFKVVISARGRDSEPPGKTRVEQWVTVSYAELPLRNDVLNFPPMAEKSERGDRGVPIFFCHWRDQERIHHVFATIGMRFGESKFAS